MDTHSMFCRSSLEKRVKMLKIANKKLLKMNNLLTRDCVEHAPKSFIKAASRTVLKELFVSDSRRCWSPTSIALAQLELENQVITMNAVEALRRIEPGEKHARKLIPSRSAVQKFKKSIAVAGSSITKPQISAEGDFVTIDASAVVEKALLDCHWPHINPADPENVGLSEAELVLKVAALPPFCVDVAADGAELTASRGMMIQGIKLVSPEIVAKLVSPKSCASGGNNNKAGSGRERAATDTGAGSSNSSNGSASNDVIPAHEPVHIDELSSELDDLLIGGGSNSSSEGTFCNVVFVHASIFYFYTPRHFADNSPTAMDIDESEGNAGAHEERDASLDLPGTVQAGPSSASQVEIPADLTHSSPEIVEENVVLAYGAQSSKTVIVTGFLHGSDSDIVAGEHNYDR